MSILNPYRELVSTMSPIDFEKYCKKILMGYAEEEDLRDFIINHDKTIVADDGTYQIDIFAEFTALSVRFKVIVECKQYKRPIEREKVVLLSDKVRSLGAHKGILIATSGFQSGAIEYAKKHGVTLIQIIDKRIMHVQNSARPQHCEKMSKYFDQMPEYYAYECNYDMEGFPDRQVFPPQSMRQQIKDKIMKEET